MPSERFAGDGVVRRGDDGGEPGIHRYRRLLPGYAHQAAARFGGLAVTAENLAAQVEPLAWPIGAGNAEIEVDFRRRGDGLVQGTRGDVLIVRVD